jgi:sugar lactone lactonase YvrE
VRIGILGCGHVGDDDLRTLYITTAARGAAHEPLAGAVFACRPGVAGVPATPFAG